MMTTLRQIIILTYIQLSFYPVSYMQQDFALKCRMPSVICGATHPGIDFLKRLNPFKTKQQIKRILPRVAISPLDKIFPPYSFIHSLIIQGTVLIVLISPLDKLKGKKCFYYHVCSALRDGKNNFITFQIIRSGVKTFIH